MYVGYLGFQPNSLFALVFFALWFIVKASSKTLPNIMLPIC